mmetsp:Transcript_20612/g.50633  ORF Transcript_20612/g.50633 Transcript_20612/m.50633 type:complete len:461 (-) Transcript_20612:191-1573(-)
MLQIEVKDYTGRNLGNDEFQNGNSMAGGLLVVRELGFNQETDCAGFLLLTRILSQTTGKLQTIDIEVEDSQDSPEYLAFLIAACSKAHEVRHLSCYFRDATIACFVPSLMNPHGIKELAIKGIEASAYQARLLFQSVASSSSLQKLELDVSFEEPDGLALIEALQQNRSLRSLSIKLTGNHGHPRPENVFRAAAMIPTLEELSIESQPIHPNATRRLPFSVLQECLCREDCLIRKLKLTDILLEGDLPDSPQQNSSLTTLELRRNNLTCSQVVRFAKSFKSLQHLDTDFNPTSELAPLDELLLEEESTLQSLELFCQPEDDMRETWIEFIEKLPRMHSLRRLRIPCKVFQSELCRRELDKALWHNDTTIENMTLLDMTGSDLGREDYIELHSRIFLPLHLKRRGLRIPLEQPLPRKLWPLVLERAMTLEDYEGFDTWEDIAIRSLPLNAIYWLLREKYFT